MLWINRVRCGICKRVVHSMRRHCGGRSQVFGSSVMLLDGGVNARDLCQSFVCVCVCEYTLAMICLSIHFLNAFITIIMSFASHSHTLSLSHTQARCVCYVTSVCVCCNPLYSSCLNSHFNFWSLTFVSVGGTQFSLILQGLMFWACILAIRR